MLVCGLIDFLYVTEGRKQENQRKIEETIFLQNYCSGFFWFVGLGKVAN